jgi:hypothetical protein
VNDEIAPVWILRREYVDQGTPSRNRVASDAKEMIARVATGINEKGAFGADGAPTEIRAPTKHARPVVNEPPLNAPCAAHAVPIADTTRRRYSALRGAPGSSGHSIGTIPLCLIRSGRPRRQPRGPRPAWTSRTLLARRAVSPRPGYPIGATPPRGGRPSRVYRADGAGRG